MSVNQKRYQRQLIKFESFEKSLDELTKEISSAVQSKYQGVSELLQEMSLEAEAIKGRQVDHHHSLEDIEHRRNIVMSAFDSLTLRKSDLKEVQEDLCRDIEVSICLKMLSCLPLDMTPLSFILQALQSNLVKMKEEDIDKKRDLSDLIEGM